MKIKAPNASAGSFAARILVSENGYLKIQGFELYAQSFIIGQNITVDDAEEILEDVGFSEVPVYDGDLEEHIMTVNTIISAIDSGQGEPGGPEVPDWSPTMGYLAVGAVVSYQDDCFEVIQMHKPQTGWEPDKVPALFKRLGPIGQPEGGIPEWVRPTGVHDAYNTGDKVSFEGEVYESMIDANVYSPLEYLAGWMQL